MSLKHRMKAVETALKRNMTPEQKHQSRAERMTFIRECLDGKHPEVMPPERIAQIPAMLESHC